MTKQQGELQKEASSSAAIDAEKTRLAEKVRKKRDGES
tara:strand:+ start:124 stop:237 length:114 start_codon:yes stop_codon:yes gene_type:complete